MSPQGPWGHLVQAGQVWIPYPPGQHISDYPRRAAAWVSLMIEPTLMRAVPALAEYPRAAARVAWRSTHALIRARGTEETGMLAMSNVVPEGELDGWLPEDDIAVLRTLELDPAEGPGPDVLRQRLERLSEAGPLPHHFLT